MIQEYWRTAWLQKTAVPDEGERPGSSLKNQKLLDDILCHFERKEMESKNLKIKILFLLRFLHKVEMTIVTSNQQPITKD